MKKLVIAICMMLGLAGAATAQTAAPATTTTTKAAKVVKMKTPKTAPAKGMKADGTPDMRLKENKAKAAAPVTGPTKKDGTPDMRYKDNKKKKGTSKQFYQSNKTDSTWVKFSGAFLLGSF